MEQTNGISKLRMKILDEGGPQYMIAARAGISPSRLSEYVLMQRRIPPHHLVALCRVLKCNPEDIIGLAPIDVPPLYESDTGDAKVYSVK